MGCLKLQNTAPTTQLVLEVNLAEKNRFIIDIEKNIVKSDVESMSNRCRIANYSEKFDKLQAETLIYKALEGPSIHLARLWEERGLRLRSSHGRIPKALHGSVSLDKPSYDREGYNFFYM